MVLIVVILLSISNTIYLELFEDSHFEFSQLRGIVVNGLVFASKFILCFVE